MSAQENLNPQQQFYPGADRKAFGPQLPTRGTRLTHKEYGPIVVTSVRPGYQQPTVNFTTAELWDEYGVKRGYLSYGIRAFAKGLKT